MRGLTNRGALGTCAVEPDVHGGDGASVVAALGLDPASVLDLSMSMNPYAGDIVPVVARHAAAVRRYPDARDATALFAEAVGVEPSRVLLTNGGAEAIALVARRLGSAAVVEPEFSLWRRHLLLEETAGRVRSNPNNPTGVLAKEGDRALAWDEAFYPLATGAWTRGDADEGALVVGSLTKVFSCPGLRLGYLLAPDEAVIAELAALQPLWSVGSLALAVLPDLLLGCDLAAWSKAIGKLRSEVVALLTGAGLAAISADAPWVLIPNAPGLRDGLARQGVVVRDCASFGLPGTVRMALPPEAELGRLALALEAAVEARP